MAEELEVQEGAEIGTESAGQELKLTTTPGTEEGQKSEEKNGEETTPKTFTQEELEAELGKRLARERRKFERQQQQQSTEPPPLQIESKLDPNQFKTTEEYLEALANERAEAIVAHRERSKSVNEVNNKYQNQIDAALEKYPDYEQVAHTHPYMTQEMAQAIKASDIAVELGYYLGSNLKEAERIFKLPSMLQIKELGKLEARLETTPPEIKKLSAAPTPIKPVQSSKSTIPVYDTTDPRSAEKMSTEEWIAADRRRRMKAAQK